MDARQRIEDRRATRLGLWDLVLDAERKSMPQPIARRVQERDSPWKLTFKLFLRRVNVRHRFPDELSKKATLFPLLILVGFTSVPGDLSADAKSAHCLSDATRLLLGSDRLRKSLLNPTSDMLVVCLRPERPHKSQTRGDLVQSHTLRI